MDEGFGCFNLLRRWASVGHGKGVGGWKRAWVWV